MKRLFPIHERTKSDFRDPSQLNDLITADFELTFSSIMLQTVSVLPASVNLPLSQRSSLCYKHKLRSDRDSTSARLKGVVHPQMKNQSLFTLMWLNKGWKTNRNALHSIQLHLSRITKTNKQKEKSMTDALQDVFRGHTKQIWPTVSSRIKNAILLHTRPIACDCIVMVLAWHF